MKLEKRHIVTFLVEADELERAERADEVLPQLVDVEDDAEELRSLGIDPGLLATQIGNLEP
jgi:hypothetical protein